VETERYPHLLSPIDVGGLSLPNRVIKAPQDTHFVGLDGQVEDRVLALYEALARGGVSLILLASVPPIAMAPAARQIAIWDDSFIPGLAGVAAAVHRHGSFIFAQLNHGGPAEVDHYPSGRAWSASTLEANQLPSPPPFFKPTRGLGTDEIEAVENAYVDAAVRAHSAGYDGVEIHAAHTYLLASFFTRVWNKRDDEFGPQSAASRTKIVRNIIAKIRHRLGDDYPIGVRINGQEWSAPGALNVGDAIANAQELDRDGIAYLSVTGYGHGPVPFKYVPEYWRYPQPQPDMEPFVAISEEEGLLIPPAAAIKQAVAAPVVGVGGLDPDRAERALANGMVDLVAMGRPLWADHDLVNKLKAGRAADIRPCTKCATCEASPRRCRVNAALGTVDDYELRPADQPRRVMIIGGGPAGMEAARVAASRGHHVTLLERQNQLGGLLPLAVMVKGTDTEDILSYLEYLRSQLDALNVDVQLGRTAAAADIAATKPDVVIVATGGKYQMPEVPGISSSIVTSSAELARKAKHPLRFAGPRLTRAATKLYLPFGKHVIVIGARIEGVETAEFLIKRGRSVTIVDTADSFGLGMPERLLMRLRVWLQERQTPIHLGVSLEEITNDGLHLVASDGRRSFIEADDIVIALPQVADTTLADALATTAPEVHYVGPPPGGEPWLIVDAVAAGFRVAKSV